MSDNIETENLHKKIKSLKREIHLMQEQAYRRNLELDALHYVWCDGGCPKGVHRYGEHPPLTKEIVKEAQRSVKRLTQWYNNSEFRTLPVKDRMDYYIGFKHVKERIESLEAKIKQLEENI